MKAILTTLFLWLCIHTASNAQQLVYTPVNPSFGGNPLNYSWLLASANAQNKFDDNQRTTNTSLLDSFGETIKRQILSQLSRNFFEDNENLNDMESGTFEIGNLIVTIDETRTGTVIRIIDNQTGELTEIIL